MQRLCLPLAVALEHTLTCRSFFKSSTKMGTISRLIRNTREINPREIVGTVLEANKDDLVKAQQQQMLEGKKSDGNRIGKYKDKRYRQKKFNMNPLAGYGNKDLKLTGEFHRGIKVYFFTTAFFFTSTDAKTPKLVAEYGEEIFGLSKQKQKQVGKEIVAPQARAEIIRQTLK